MASGLGLHCLLRTVCPILRVERHCIVYSLDEIWLSDLGLH